MLLCKQWDGSAADDGVKSAYEYVINLRERLKNTCRMAVIELQQAQEVAQYYYDQKTRDRNILVGDDVLLLLPTNANKLLFQWKGPFRVLGSPNKWSKMVDVMCTAEAKRKQRKLLSPWCNPTMSIYVERHILQY